MSRSLFLIALLCLGTVGSFAATTAPSDFRITQLFSFNFSASLTWTNNAPNAYGYDIYRSASANGTFVFHTDVSTPNPITTIYLTAQQSLGTYFKIRARTFDNDNGYGTTGFSEPLLIAFEGPGRQVLSNAGASGAVPEYLLHLPSDYDSNGGSYPVLVYLHDSNAIGGNANTLRSSGPPKLADAQDPMVANTFIIVSPHMAAGGVEQWYDPSRSSVVLDILEYVLRNYRTDNLRTYLTGSGRGGTGTLGIFSKFPGQFAAVLEASGSGAGIDADGYDALHQKAIWMHHGTADTNVPFADAETLANNCSQPYGPPKQAEYTSSEFDSPYDSTYVRFSVYTGFGSNVAATMYSDSRVYSWLLTHWRNLQGPNINAASVGGGEYALTPITMFVSAMGERLKFRWFKDGDPIPGATSNTFSLPAPTTDDEGYYQVEITNRDGTSIAQGNLNIFKLGVSLIEPANPITFEYGTPLTAALFSSLIVMPDIPGVFTLEAPNFEGEILELGRQVNVHFRPDATNAYYETSVSVTPTQTDRPATIIVPDITRIYGEDSLIEFGQQGVLERDLEIMESNFEVTSTTDLVSAGVHTYTPQARDPIPGYNFTYVSGTLTILPAPLTISANNQVRVAGKPNPEFTASFSGFKTNYGDGPLKLSAKPVFTTTATLDSPPGEYPITVSGAASPNYTISYVAGSLIITNTPPSFSSDSIMNVPTDPVVNQPVHWFILASDPDEQSLTYTWDFGDGTTSSDVNPIHIYTTPGKYTATVSVSDGFETITKGTSITVGAGGALASNVNFWTSDVVGFAAVPLEFNGVPSFYPQHSIKDFSWDFGDGTVGNGVLFSKTFEAAGTYLVTMTAQDYDGTTASISRPVVILTAAQSTTFDPFLEFAVNLDRTKPPHDTLQLKARLNIGGEKLSAGSPVVLEIAGQRFRATLDRRLRATVKAAPQQSWKVRWGSRSQESGETDVQVTIKNANLSAWSEPIPPLPKYGAAGFFAPLRLQIQSHAVEVNCSGYLKPNRSDTKLSGKGALK